MVMLDDMCLFRGVVFSVLDNSIAILLSSKTVHIIDLSQCLTSITACNSRINCIVVIASFNAVDGAISSSSVVHGAISFCDLDFQVIGQLSHLIMNHVLE